MLTKPENTQIVPAPDLDGLLTPWLDALALRVRTGEMSADTAKTYEAGARKFLAWLGGSASLQESAWVSADIVRQWMSELENKRGAVNTWLNGVNAFFAWCVQVGALPVNPMTGIKRAQRKNSRSHRREALTDTEVRRVLALPDPDTKEGKRDLAILSLMLYTAARSIEVHRADLDDLRPDNGNMVLMVQGKGSDEKDEMLVLPPPAESVMRDWLSVRGKTPGALFVSLSNRSRMQRLSRRALRDIVSGYLTAAGVIGNKSTHSLRHTAITNAIRRGAPVQKVKGMSRHASLDTLMIYYHEVDRLEDPAERYIDYGE